MCKVLYQKIKLHVRDDTFTSEKIYDSLLSFADDGGVRGNWAPNYDGVEIDFSTTRKNLSAHIE